jgi:hypothetical protein
MITEDMRTYASYVQAWAIFLLLIIVARKPGIVDEVLNEVVAKIIKIIKNIINHIITGGAKK